MFSITPCLFCFFSLNEVCSFMYHVGLRAWDEVFESERWRWFFIEIDEFRTEQEKHLSALSGFLGIDHIMKEIQAASRRGVARNASTMPTFKLNSGSYPMMAQATRRLLANFYRPHNRILENWIGRAFETWDWPYVDRPPMIIRVSFSSFTPCIYLLCNSGLLFSLITNKKEIDTHIKFLSQIRHAVCSLPGL